MPLSLMFVDEKALVWRGVLTFAIPPLGKNTALCHSFKEQQLGTVVSIYNSTFY